MNCKYCNLLHQIVVENKVTIGGMIEPIYIKEVPGDTVSCIPLEQAMWQPDASETQLYFNGIMLLGTPVQNKQVSNGATTIVECATVMRFIR